MVYMPIKKMKRILLFITSIFYLICCNGNSNAKNKSDKITPIYAIKIDAIASYKLFINDILVSYYHDKGATSITLPINREILSSGQQRIRVELNSEENLDSSVLKYYDFKVVKYRNADSPDYDNILTLDFTREKDMVTKKLTSEWSFYAEVSYENEGWSHSVNLLKENKEKLLSEVKATYQEFDKILTSKNASLYYAKTKEREAEVNKCLYLTNETIKDEKVEMESTFSKISTVLPLENYKIVFYAEGRIISLIRIDKDNMDESAIQAELTDGSTEIFELLLHRPKPGAPLEIIR
jgi:hypothetical protein